VRQLPTRVGELTADVDDARVVLEAAEHAEPASGAFVAFGNAGPAWVTGLAIRRLANRGAPRKHLADRDRKSCRDHALRMSGAARKTTSGVGASSNRGKRRGATVNKALSLGLALLLVVPTLAAASQRDWHGRMARRAEIRCERRDAERDARRSGWEARRDGMRAWMRASEMALRDSRRATRDAWRNAVRSARQAMRQAGRSAREAERGARRAAREAMRTWRS